MNPSNVGVWQNGVVEGFEVARRDRKPIFVPVAVFADDRGWSIMNQLQGILTPQGQVNYSIQYPGVVKAWHRHQKQTDFWLCVQGHIKAGVYDQDAGRVWQAVIGEKNPGVLIVPPMLWHGIATVGPTSAGLFYYVTHAYDPQQPDEERRPYDSVDGLVWKVEYR